MVTFLPGKLAEIEADGGIEKTMKLATKLSTSNMHLFDAESRIQKYETPEQILQTFFEMRREFYHKRKVRRPRYHVWMIARLLRVDEGRLSCVWDLWSIPS